MNLSALPELLLAWVKNQGTVLLQGEKAQTPTFQAGQQYEGKVVDNLANGRHLVRVGGQMLDMNLPTRTQPGETVRLTNINSGPRPTFLLNQTPVTPTQRVEISNTAQQVNALLRLAQTPAASAPAAVSAALARTGAAAPSTASIGGTRATATPPEIARPPGAALPTAATPTAGTPPRPIVANVVMLQSYNAVAQPTTATLIGPNTGLLGQAVDAPRGMVPSSTTLSANTLVELPAASRQTLPARLSQTVSGSGLFYESHLAKWSNGMLSLESIQREPQARLAHETPLSARLAELGGMPEEAARMAGRQLQMLEGAPFLWQGLAWPGQAMQWQIREEAGGEGRGESDGTASDWVTELNLTLPRMGQVHAQLALSGERLRLRLLASEPATRAAMTEALPLLAKGFEMNALQAVELHVAEMAAETSNGAA